MQSNNHTKDVAMNKYRTLLLGDPAPPFRQRSNGGRVFDSSAALGRYNVLCFFVTTSDAPGKAALSAIKDKRPLYGDLKFAFLGISVDPQDECKVRSGANLPAIRYIWDFDGTVSRLFGSVPRDSMPGDGDYSARRFWLLLDPALRAIALFPFAGDGSEQSTVFAALDELPCTNAGSCFCWAGSGR